MIACVVAPVDQIFPVVADDVKITLLPAQIVVDPDVVIVGVAGVVFTVTVLTADGAESHPPLL